LKEAGLFLAVSPHLVGVITNKMRRCAQSLLLPVSRKQFLTLGIRNFVGDNTTGVRKIKNNRFCHSERSEESLRSYR